MKRFFATDTQSHKLSGFSGIGDSEIAAPCFLPDMRLARCSSVRYPVLRQCHFKASVVQWIEQGFPKL